MRLGSSLLLVLILATAARGEDTPKAATIDGARALLETLVDLPDAELRADMAKRLASRDDISLATWLSAAKTFGTFPKVKTGAHSETVSVRVGAEDVSMRFTSYVPAKYDPTLPAPLLMSFHGTGGDGTQSHQGWQSVADELGMLVVCPGDTMAAQGYTASQAERDRAWAALRLARRRFNVDENRIYATGISRGGHLTWDLALRQPDRFAGIAPMIGSPRLSPAGGQNNLRYLENLVNVSIRDLQGLKDDPLMIQNLRYAFARLEAFKARDAEFVTFEDRGHDFDLSSVDWIAWFKSATRAPIPERLVRRFAKAGQGRHAFLDVLKASNKVHEIPQLKVGREWNRMSKAEQREYMADYIEKHTARVEVVVEPTGQLTIKATNAKRARLLLPAEMLGGDDRVEIRWNAKKLKRRVTRSALVLLSEFAERFDRTFLPIAVVKVP